MQRTATSKQYTPCVKSDTPYLSVHVDNTQTVTQLQCTTILQVEHLVTALLAACLSQPYFSISKLLKLVCKAIYNNYTSNIQSYNVD